MIRLFADDITIYREIEITNVAELRTLKGPKSFATLGASVAAQFQYIQVPFIKNF